MTIQPVRTNAETTVFADDYRYFETFTGNVTATIPSGHYSILTSTPGYYDERREGNIGSDQVELTVVLKEELRADYSYFTTTRYEAARITLYDLRTNQDIGYTSIRASCKENGYPNLVTTFAGAVNLVPASSQNIILSHSGGFPYFTDNIVRCSIWGEIGDYEVGISKRY